MPTREEMERAQAMWNGQPLPAPALAPPPAPLMSVEPPPPTGYEPFESPGAGMTFEQPLPGQLQSVEAAPPMSAPPAARISHGATGSWGDEAQAAQLDRSQALDGAVQGTNPPPAPPPNYNPQVRGNRPVSLLDEQRALAGQSSADAAAAQDEIDRSALDLKVAGEVEADRAREQGGAEADVLAKQNEALEQHGRESMARVQIRQKVADDRAKEYEAMNKANAQIEIKDRRSTGQRVMGALAIALGGIADQGNLAAGLNIGQNVQTHNADRAVSMVNDMVARDLEIQRANLDNKKAGAAAKFNEYGIALDAVKDEQQAKLLAEASIKEKYSNQLKQIERMGLGDKAANAAREAAAKIDFDIAATRAQVAEGRNAADEQRLFQLEVQREQERKAAAAARAKGPDVTVAELERKERAGTITPGELKALTDLRKGAIDVEKGKRDLTSPGGANQSEGDKKLARLTAGVQGSVENLLPYMGKEGKDIPYFGVRGVAKPGSTLESVTPDAFIPDDNITFRNSVDAVTNVLLRDESGANLPPDEVSAKKKAWGIESGSHDISKAGLNLMLAEYAARKRNGTLPPSIDAQPVE